MTTLAATLATNRTVEAASITLSIGHRWMPAHLAPLETTPLPPFSILDLPRVCQAQAVGCLLRPNPLDMELRMTTINIKLPPINTAGAVADQEPTTTTSNKAVAVKTKDITIKDRTTTRVMDSIKQMVGAVSVTDITKLKVKAVATLREVAGTIRATHEDEHHPRISSGNPRSELSFWWFVQRRKNTVAVEMIAVGFTTAACNVGCC